MEIDRQPAGLAVTTVFINHFDPRPRTRRVLTFHRPETLREWLTADTLDAWLKQSGGFYTAAFNFGGCCIRIESPPSWRPSLSLQLTVLVILQTIEPASAARLTQSGLHRLRKLLDRFSEPASATAASSTTSSR